MKLEEKKLWGFSSLLNNYNSARISIHIELFICVQMCQFECYFSVILGFYTAKYCLCIYAMVSISCEEEHEIFAHYSNFGTCVTDIFSKFTYSIIGVWTAMD